MGSLMAGWDSPVQDPKTVIYRRNKSLTNKAIETYWKSKKTDEEHVGSHSNSTKDGQENQYKGSERRMRRSTSLPLTDRRDSITSIDDSANSGTENLNKPNGWWTRSIWAFLNEPPVKSMDGPSYKYASQYSITGFHHSKSTENSEMTA